MSAFLPVIDAFNRAGVSYVIVGGLANVLHGHLRVTSDVDFVIRLDPANASRAVEVIQLLGYRPRVAIDPTQFADEEIRKSWVRDKGMMVLSFFDPQDVTRSADLFAEYPMDYDQLLSRSVVRNTSGIEARVCSLDDLIAMKRAAGRAIDREDVKALEALRRHE